jgi:hypothetical protein
MVALNSLKRGDRVRHVKSNGRSHWYKSLNNGTVENVSRSGKTVYVRWVNDGGDLHHWARYRCEMLEKIE